MALEAKIKGGYALSKDEVARKLVENGYQAEIKDGVLMVHVSNNDYNAPAKIRKILEELGYCASWGMKIRKEARDEEG